jgi:hypothetical protein
LLKHLVHGEPREVVPAIAFDGTEPDPLLFMHGSGNLAKMFIAIHESSHAGPGRHLPDLQQILVPQMIAIGSLMGAPRRRAAEWAEEASIVANALLIMHTEVAQATHFWWTLIKWQFSSA